MKKLKRVLVFPGQGCQFIGMGKDIYNTSKLVFDEADQILNQNLSKLMFEGDEKELTRTSNAQPAILTHCMAIYKNIEKNYIFDCTLGHSLGEYTSLCVSGAINFSDALKLVRKRGEIMEETIKDFEMCVLMPCSIETAEEICKETEKQTQKVCDIAGINSKTQITISGDKEAIECAIELAKKKGIRRPLKLKVGGPFHSKLMRESAEKMSPLLKKIDWKVPKIPVISNVTAKKFENEIEIPELLTKQIYTRVNFYQSMEECKKEENTEIEFYEVGPKPTLLSLYKEEKTFNINK